jgi:hypothetical protein
MLLRETTQGAKQIYRIQFAGVKRTFSLYREINAAPGDSITVYYSPFCPRKFRIRVPSIWWIAAWAILYLVSTPPIVYYGALFFRMQCKT